MFLGDFNIGWFFDSNWLRVLCVLCWQAVEEKAFAWCKRKKTWKAASLQHNAWPCKWSMEFWLFFFVGRCKDKRTHAWTYPTFFPKHLFRFWLDMNAAWMSMILSVYFLSKMDPRPMAEVSFRCRMKCQAHLSSWCNYARVPGTLRCKSLGTNMEMPWHWSLAGVDVIETLRSLKCPPKRPVWQAIQATIFTANSIVRKDSPSQQCSHFSDGTTIQHSTVEHCWTIAIVCWTPCETKKPPFVHIDSFTEERPRLLHPAPLSEDIWGRPPSRGAKGDLLGNGTSGTAPHAKHRLHWGWTLVSSVQRSGLWT